MYQPTLRGPRIEMQHPMLLLIESKKYVSWNRRHEDSDVVRDILNASILGRVVEHISYIVSIMDTAYKINRYRLQLLRVVDMTSTESTYDNIGGVFFRWLHMCD